MPSLTPNEVLAQLERVARGEDRLTAEQNPTKVWAGDVTYVSKSGWKLVVFNDCNSWDYLDSAVSPDGRTWDFGDCPYPQKLLDPACAYRPASDELDWLAWRIPGYLQSEAQAIEMWGPSWVEVKGA